MTMETPMCFPQPWTNLTGKPYWETLLGNHPSAGASAEARGEPPFASLKERKKVMVPAWGIFLHISSISYQVKMNYIYIYTYTYTRHEPFWVWSIPTQLAPRETYHVVWPTWTVVQEMDQLYSFRQSQGSATEPPWEDFDSEFNPCGLPRELKQSEMTLYMFFLLCGYDSLPHAFVLGSDVPFP